MSARVGRALITGASAGIGAEFARQLAAKRVDLVLVARRRERLEQLAGELDVDVEVLPADLADPAELAEVEARLAAVDHPVDLLINNAGFGAYGGFSDLALSRQAGMIDVNVTALVRLSRVAVDGFLERGGGGVINVGSTAGYQPNPDGAVYGATKAFVRSFTEALHEELRGTGVRAMLCAPGFTTSEFHAVAGVAPGAMPAALRMDAEVVVATALRDFAAGRAVSVPGAANRLTALGSQLVPSALSRRVSAIIHRRFVRS